MLQINKFIFQASPIWLPADDNSVVYNGHLYRIFPADQFDSDSYASFNRLAKRAANTVKRERIVMDTMDGYLIR